MRRTATAAAVVVALLAAATAAPAQEWRRLLDDLGQGDRSEGSERGLLALGASAVPALQQVFDAWDTTEDAGIARLRAALRVVGLLGERARDVQPVLIAAVLDDNSARVRPRGDRDYLLPEVLNAIADLTPYGEGTRFHDLFHHSMVNSRGPEKGPVFVAVYRYQQRAGCKAETLEQARTVLAADAVFAREVAAEVLFRSGERSDAALLRDRLLARDHRPKGWDALTHNGFVVPCEDRFALRAARALVRIAPDDEVSAIGYAVLAERHPHRSQRLQALQRLARFGPDAAPTVPELLSIARGDDSELAAEALKVLGMCGRATGAHVTAIAALSASDDAQVSKRASSLVRMLEAMGFTAEEGARDGTLAARRSAMKVAVAALGDSETEAVTAAEALLVEDIDLAFPLLVDRLRHEAFDCPDRVVSWIARLGRSRSERERLELCHALAADGDEWSGPRFSSSSGGGRGSTARYEAYGWLWIGAPDDLTAIATFLSHDNVAVRLAGARDLAARSDELSGGASPEAEAALWQAVTGVHPETSRFEGVGRRLREQQLDLADAIRTAAAVALLATEQPVDRHAALLRHTLHHDSAETVARAIVAWGDHASLAELRQAMNDKRPAVAAAAENAVARREADK